MGLDGVAPQQVTFAADANVGGVQWSPDGKFLLYRSSQRTETPRIIRVDLVPRTPRFREDQFRDLFGPPRATLPRRDGSRPAATSPTACDPSTAPAPTAPVTIAFTGIRLRSSIVPTQGLDIGALAISPDGRTLAFTAVAGGQQQIYTWLLDELARDQQLRTLTTSPGGKSALQFSADSRDLWYLEGGRISAITVESRVARTVAASAEVDIAFEAEKRAIFDQARSYLANNFFDATMHGVDWSGLAARVEPYAMGSRNPDDLRRVMSLMIGELNGSHLGVSGPTTGGVSVPMARLGVQFDRVALEQRGQYRVAEVIAQGPAAVAGVTVGDQIVAVDGVTLVRAIVAGLGAGGEGRSTADRQRGHCEFGAHA
ncbi:MAG: PD40 domain-containing protein [Gemmatimonadaceae bacterium]|nr:PD40 domain-containing protein [Gemmatimonadaceae bacterium]